MRAAKGDWVSLHVLQVGPSAQNMQYVRTVQIIQKRVFMSEEKRQSSRIFFAMPAELILSDTSYHVNQIVNLSVGGCLLEIKDNLPVGTGCEIKILIDGTPKGLRVNANGEIVRNDSETVGIKFTRIDPESLFHLQNIVRFSLPILKFNPESRSRPI